MKIKSVMPFSNLNLKWALQAQFLSHTPATLKSYVFLIDVQMILLSFFGNPNQKYINQENPILSVQSVLLAGQIDQLVGQINQTKSVFLVFLIFGQEYEKIIVISFEDLSKIHRIPKLRGCDFKIEPVMLISNSKWKWAWPT